MTSQRCSFVEWLAAVTHVRSRDASTSFMAALSMEPLSSNINTLSSGVMMSSTTYHHHYHYIIVIIVIRDVALHNYSIIYDYVITLSLISKALLTIRTCNEGAGKGGSDDL